MFSTTNSIIVILMIYVSSYFFFLHFWFINLACSIAYFPNFIFFSYFHVSFCFISANINSSAIVAAASVVSRTLYILASDRKALSSSALASVSVNSSLVDELLGCLLKCEPGLSCELVKHYISPRNSCPSHYVGVVVGEPSSNPYIGYVNDVPRFVWNFLADKTSIPSKNVSSACPKDCSDAGELCVRAETDGKGVCVISTTRYPAFSMS